MIHKFLQKAVWPCGPFCLLQELGGRGSWLAALPASDPQENKDKNKKKQMQKNQLSLLQIIGQKQQLRAKQQQIQLQNKHIMQKF